MQVAAHPRGKGEINRWGSLPRRPFSSEDNPGCVPGDFATLSCLRVFSTKRSFPGDCSRAEEKTEGGSVWILRLERKAVRGRGGALGLQTVKFAVRAG